MTISGQSESAFRYSCFYFTNERTILQQGHKQIRMSLVCNRQQRSELLPMWSPLSSSCPPTDYAIREVELTLRSVIPRRRLFTSSQ